MAERAAEPHRGQGATVQFRDLDELGGPGTRIGDRPVTPPERVAVAFGRILRGAGLPTPLDTIVTFAAALDAVGLDRRDDVYWAACSTLVRRPEDIELFDRAFSVFWDRRRVSIDLTIGGQEQVITITVDDEDADESANDDSIERNDGPSIHLRFSSVEVLGQKDFAVYSDDELDEAHRLMSRLRFVGSSRPSRRLVASRRTSPRVDMRRTVRAALRSGGESIKRHHLEPGERTRRLVLLLDVSGSMEPYARALLRFVHAAAVSRQRVEVFTLGTRLTRVTREISNRDPDRALSNATQSVADWSGGTRLGDGLRAFNDEWGVRGMARGSTVVILSDGWDRGDPDDLREQMQRLQRIAFQIVWVNPLKVTPGYAPLARGMAAALPFVDDFVEGHSLDAMAELARVISRSSRRV